MILVTGASGVVGRAVMEELRANGHEPIGVSRRPVAPGDGRWVVSDLASGRELTEAVDGVPSAVVHLAAAVPHRDEYADTAEAASVTRRIDGRVVAAVARWDVPVVYASTCGVYDRSRAEPAAESDTGDVRPESPYFAAKLDGERVFASCPGWTVVRLAGVIGPGMPENLVVSRFVRTALADGKVTVWGSGRREQNYVDARDVARGVAAAVDTPAGAVVNLAAPHPVTMMELAQEVVEAVGSGTVVQDRRLDPREGEFARFSIRRAQRALDWRPEIPLVDTLRWLAGSMREAGS